MKGRVIKSTGSWYTVLDDNNNIIDCRIKGKFRTTGIKSTNPIAVGDLVEFEVEEKEDIAVINKLFERKNYIIRKSVNLSHQIQILASNIDLAILVVTLAYPKTSLGFIDRFLVSAEAYHIPSVILFNKFDIYEEEDIEYLEYVKSMYEKIGYNCYSISAANNHNIDLIREITKDKISLFSGHSGVGKSTLTNLLIPNKNLKTTEISDSHNKGMHTTTFAEMHTLPYGGFIIDSPGIRELGIVDIKKEELFGYFPDIKKFSPNCKFNNCSHQHEPNCAVVKAVENGDIEVSRYDSFISIYNNFETRG